MIEIVLIISFACIGLHVCTWKDMIFYPITEGYDKYINILIERNDSAMHQRLWLITLTAIRKPLFACPMCMSSIWTLIIWPLLGLKFCWIIPVIMLAVCGVNTVIVSLIKNIIPDE